MSIEVEKRAIRTAIAALEGQRALLGDAVVEVSVGALHARLISLASPALSEQQLKLVTILFLDMVGSTPLSRHLEPEEIHVFMEGALLRFSKAVEAHSGRVLRLAGDNLLAAFGVDRVNEDDAERAVRCGLSIRDEGRALATEVRRDYGHAGFDVRVGIHTGVVLVGGAIDAGIHGIAVNIAARMEQTAPAGGVRISHSTYSHVRDLFDVSPPELIEVKGINEPIVGHLVHRSRRNSSRITQLGLVSMAIRIIGRGAELQHLQDAFDHLLEKRLSRRMLVSAEAGLGKSRLLYEFYNWANAQPNSFIALWGRATPEVIRQPYGLLRRVLATLLQLADDDNMDEAKQKCEQGVSRLFESHKGLDSAAVQAHAHVLGYLIGLDFGNSKHVACIRDDSSQIRDRGFYVAAQLLWRTAGDLPLVLLLDDLHWADDESLDFLAYLTQFSRDMPMMVLASARPVLFERCQDMTGGFDQHIQLPPLDQSSSIELSGELLKKLPEVPDALRDLLAGRAEGNPFFMEELVRMLLDEGAIEDREGYWELSPEKLLATRVPQTLTGVLQTRLDRLSPAEKLALQQASVVGAVFWDRALAAIDVDGIGALPALGRRELVIPHEVTSLPSAREYAFAHLILHDVTYNSMLKRVRRSYHGKVAEWLVASAGSRSNDLLGATASHFEKAGDSMRACEYYTQAAEHSRARSAHSSTLNYVEQALRLVGENNGLDSLRRRWHLIDIRERTHEIEGRRVEQLADLIVLQQIADDMDDFCRRSEVACRLSEFEFMDSEPARFSWRPVGLSQAATATCSAICR